MLSEISEEALAVVSVVALEKIAECSPAAAGWAWLAGVAHSEAARRHGRPVDARLDVPVPALTDEEREAMLAELDACIILGVERRIENPEDDANALRFAVDNLLAAAQAALNGAATMAEN